MGEKANDELVFYSSYLLYIMCRNEAEYAIQCNVQQLFPLRDSK